MGKKSQILEGAGRFSPQEILTMKFTLSECFGYHLLQLSVHFGFQAVLDSVSIGSVIYFGRCFMVQVVFVPLLLILLSQLMFSGKLYLFVVLKH